MTTFFVTAYLSCSDPSERGLLHAMEHLRYVSSVKNRLILFCDLCGEVYLECAKISLFILTEHYTDIGILAYQYIGIWMYRYRDVGSISNSTRRKNHVYADLIRSIFEVIGFS